MLLCRWVMKMRGKLSAIFLCVTIMISATVSGCSGNKSVDTAGSKTVAGNLPGGDGNKDQNGANGTNTSTSEAGTSDNNGQAGNSSTPDASQSNNNGDKQNDSTVSDDKPLDHKEVFLTFDDGPSVNTEKILKILKEKQVKASFFLVGSNVDKYPDLVKAEYNDGMALLNHSYSHDYSMYKNTDTMIGDFDRTTDAIKNILGITPLPFIRFPGGSDNSYGGAEGMRNIRNRIHDKGITYVDWNVASGDADAVKIPADKIKNNVINQASGKTIAVVLMHDAAAKTTTVDALPDIIDNLKSKGFVFRTFKDLTPTEKNRMEKAGIINRNAGK